jgi:hypothetical protein
MSTSETAVDAPAFVEEQPSEPALLLVVPSSHVVTEVDG